MDRRHFVASAAALPFALRAFALDRKEGPAKHVFLGTDKGAGIYRATWNADTGEMGAVELHVATDRPVYFARHPALPIVYVNNELSGGKAGLSAFGVGAETLTLLQHVACDDGPCYASCTSTQVYSANYAAGSLQVWPLAKGAIGTPPLSLRAPKFKHPGPVPDRQDNPHFHCAVLSPDGKQVVVCDLGSDRLLAVPVDDPLKFTVIPARVASGPRHVAFHPNGKWMYCIHELDCTIDRYDWKSDGKATLRDGSTVPLLTPGTALAGNTGCELLLSPDGRFAYACIRGVDQIVTYAIDASTGALTELQRLSSGGKIPRIITFDPSRKWLVACNQGEPGTVAVFAHDASTARLTPVHVYDAPTPMCVLWV